MKHILSCTDGSAYAPHVYDLTAWAAKRMGAAVHVLHMLDPHRERAELVDLSGNLGPDAGTGLLQELVTFEETKNRMAREQGKIIIEEARQYLLAAGIDQVSAEQQHGNLVEAVTLMENDADLVVLGKRGKTAGIAQQHLGSNLERVIRASIRPVLVASSAAAPISRFLLAYDGGPSVEKALQFAVENPLLKNLACCLLRAGRIDDNATWFLKEAGEKLRAAGYPVETHAIPGDPEHVIAEAIQRENIDLLVMGAYGHSRIRQLMIGSTTTTMIRTSHIPLLMFR